jgi:predicted P-loop ATPase
LNKSSTESKQEKAEIRQETYGFFTKNKNTDEVLKRIGKKEGGSPISSIENYLKILWYDTRIKGAICFNLLTEKIDIVRPVGWCRQLSQLNDVDMCYLKYYFEKIYGLSSEKKLETAVQIIANDNKYHPICEYLSKLEWDGTERIRFALHRYLGAEVNAYTYEVMKLFMMGALNRIYEPGCKFEYMLCLVGGQGAGKSSFFRLLAIKDDWFTDDIRRLDDENIYRKLQGHWIIEMSEMIATGNARSIEEIKSFLSKQKDTYKVPYEIHPQDRLRQCVFGGTSNALDFLPLDRTGNRRFIPIPVHPEQAEVHILDDEKASREYIDQMWAEAMTLYRAHDYKLTLPRELQDYMKELQQGFMPEDTKLGMIQEFLDTCGRDTVCSKMLFAEALGRGSEEPRKLDIREINDIMNNSVTGWLAFSNPRHFEYYGRQKGWERVRVPDNEQTTTNVPNTENTVHAPPGNDDYPFD